MLRIVLGECRCETNVQAPALEFSLSWDEPMCRMENILKTSALIQQRDRAISSTGGDEKERD